LGDWLRCDPRVAGQLGNQDDRVSEEIHPRARRGITITYYKHRWNLLKNITK
jgi:hypothetical protein